jgi:hypothetical protein
MLMIDLGAGLGGASSAMKLRGWKVITVDNDPKFHCTITTDIRTWHYFGDKPDLLWFSMPCDEFARESMPWCKQNKKPNLELIKSCLRIRDEIKPKFWVCENVKGSIKYLYPLMGNYTVSYGAYYFWGYFPQLAEIDLNKIRKKSSYSSDKKAERARIPFEISYAFARSMELQDLLPLFEMEVE